MSVMAFATISWSYKVSVYTSQKKLLGEETFQPLPKKNSSAVINITPLDGEKFVRVVVVGPKGKKYTFEQCPTSQKISVTFIPDGKEGYCIIPLYYTEKRCDPAEICDV